jgi:hypothetical protein
MGLEGSGSIPSSVHTSRVVKAYRGCNSMRLQLLCALDFGQKGAAEEGGGTRAKETLSHLRLVTRRHYHQISSNWRISVRWRWESASRTAHISGITRESHTCHYNVERDDVSGWLWQGTPTDRLQHCNNTLHTQGSKVATRHYARLTQGPTRP